ncbi:MAG: SulP family inorganic anion transporter, partial [Ruminococcus sp.]|nr:SulP family inorganic anion transporter [Ruminococcus sp.]
STTIIFMQIPKLPMSLFVMAGGALLGYTGFAEEHGVALLSSVEAGLPAWRLPDVDAGMLTDIIPASMTIAIVIMAETLLASNNLAQKNGCRLSENREILVYALGNLAAGATGCCPVNGSVSRSSMGEQYGGASQVMSLTAAAAMAVILIFFTDAVRFLPVPVLTAIVISALLGAVEFSLVKRLFRQDKRELLIFLGAFAGVLFFGTVYGVLIGVVLSFTAVIINTTNPKRSFLGVIPGHEGFHSLERNTYSVPVKSAVIYRFSGNLYFANIKLFISDIEGAVREDTRCVIVDSGAVCSIDITAADSIASLDRSLRSRGITLCFASHIGQLNDRFRQLGIGSFVEEGRCRRTLAAALSAAGIDPPYELETGSPDTAPLPYGNADRLEFEWAFGDNADAEMEKYTEKLLSGIGGESQPRQELADVIRPQGSWTGVSDLDNEKFLEHLQLHIGELSYKLGIPESQIYEAIEHRRLRIARRIEQRDIAAFNRVREYFTAFENDLKKDSPELYEDLIRRRREAVDRLRASEPGSSEMIEKLYGSTDE